MKTMIQKTALVAAMLAGMSTAAQAQSFFEGFDTPGTLPAGWAVTNNSTRASTGNTWNAIEGITDPDDDNIIVVPPYEGAGFASANFSSIGGATGSGTISNWLFTPLITGLQNGDTFSFYTTTAPGSAYPDRVELRLSTAGAGTDVGTTVTSVGTFTTVLLSINPSLSVGGYPDDWTLVTATVSGLAAPVDGRVALRYFVTSGGPTGANSNIVGVDNFTYTSAVPEPATWAMALGGIAGLAMLRRRRQD